MAPARVYFAWCMWLMGLSGVVVVTRSMWGSAAGSLAFLLGVMVPLTALLIRASSDV